mmetsp:Transcript_9878/g.11289  ORF Transcript_9878/g.11289 Transcript_9878/m.11289 type:complete len:337 (+) Transcript_9878:203-1213(+)
MSLERQTSNDWAEEEREIHEKLWGRVLSIQSHTVHGYVGNKSAVFPLQLLGFEVDPINSVQFSNHTGYRNGFKGEVLSGTQLDDLISGLEANNLLMRYSYVLTGYIGSASFLRCVLKLVQKLKQRKPEFRYFCDPVMGDHGKLYVPEALVSIYREEVVPHVSVLTPNQFELELLTGIEISSMKDVKECFSILHSKGVETIVLTSCSISLDENAEESSSGKSFLVASCIVQEQGLMSSDLKTTNSVYVASYPLIEGSYTGTGDLIAALLLAWTTKLGDDFPMAIRKAVSTMQSVLKRTLKAKKEGVNGNNELLLIQSRKSIEIPNLEGNGVEVKKIQ